mgnify:FL=1
MEEKTTRIIGRVPEIVRVPSRLYSWDRAVGFRGVLGTPGRGIIELYGDEHTGKSTLALYLNGVRSGSRELVICDLEASLDRNYIETVTSIAGHTGPVRIIDYTEPEKKREVARPHEEMLQEAIDSLLRDDVATVIVDSYGAFTSTVARGKPLGERSVGQEAKTLNDAAKRVNTWLRVVEDPKWYFVINHTNPNIGGAGFTTPGGKKTKYLSVVRAWIRRVENDWPKGTGNFVSEIVVQKLKYGAKGRRAWVYFIPGFGVSPEMTAVTDCIKLKIAKADATVKLQLMDGDDKEWKWMSQGRIGTLAEKAMNPKKHKATFQPFFEALEKYNKENPDTEAVLEDDEVVAAEE